MKTNILSFDSRSFSLFAARTLLASLLVTYAGFPALLSTLSAQGLGVVEGKLVNGTDPSIVGAGVDLDVVGFGGGMSIIKSAVTDSSGKFHIDGLPTNMPLMIRANYKSANYHGQVNFDAAGKAFVEIEIFETTTSMAGIREQSIRMAFQLAGDRLRSLESVSFENQSKPPRTFMSTEGNYRFSKLPGILEPPQIDVSGPGAVMPLTQSPLESPDGQSYYSLYPLRPGITTFEVQESLPYTERKYVYRRKFYEDLDAIQVGVTPQNIDFSGEGLKKIQVDPQKGFAVYSAGPIKAGTEVVWTFSGGSPRAEPEVTESSGETTVKPVATSVGRNALVIGPLLLMGFITVLWYAFNHMQAATPEKQSLRMRELKSRRDQLLTYLANLDNRYESKSLERREYLREREQGKRELRRISLLIKK